MDTPERQPELPQVTFLEMTRQLDEDDFLVLSRNRVRHIRGGEVYDWASVHYEGLNYLTETYQPLHSGELVTNEFMKSAVDLADSYDDTPGVTYPYLTVINDRTNQRITEKINIAELITNDQLPVYSVPSRSTRGGEAISLGFNTLIKSLASKVGVNPVGAVGIDDASAFTVEEIGLGIWTHFPAKDKKGESESVESDPGAHFDPRGAAALSLLQLDASEAFAVNRHRVTEGANGRVEVVVRVGRQPDLQTVILTLVDLVEARGMQLVYSHGGIATGEVGSIIGIMDAELKPCFILSAERTLDMAIHNAYLAAKAMFPELYQ